MSSRERLVIAIEGIDGSGKTTLINNICTMLDGKINVYQKTSKGVLMDKILSSKVLNKNLNLQYPLYLLLSYKNYIHFKIKDKKKNPIVMDRCFLSNLCYFFPEKMFNENLLKILLIFEINLMPKTIFILDIDPYTAQMRDGYKKDINWLKRTRNAYLKSTELSSFKNIRIVPIDSNLSLEEKRNIIIKTLQGDKNNGN